MSPRRPGEHVVHIGAGTGYYSAILAELVGDEGRVTSIEFDAALAARAQRNLADRSNVACIKGNGFDWPQGAVDVAYVNFAAARPARSWVENLNVGGRLVFPLGVPRAATPMIGQGLNAIALLVTRHIGGYSAKPLGRVSFVYAESEEANVPQEEIDALRDRSSPKVHVIEQHRNPTDHRTKYIGALAEQQMSVWVKIRNTRTEQMFSASPPNSDLA
jgi:protein-L-isoaspartate(D-aspartate) O-methyltransferase